MKTVSSEFAPLETEQAIELEEIINRAAREKGAVLIDPDEAGITGLTAKESISTNDRINALARYQRHY